MRIRMGMLVAAGLACFGGTAHAQVVGTFSWQTQPHCNHLSLTITQQGGVYQLTGVDDLCGAGTAPITGTAIPTSAGVAMGFAVALGNGRTSHVSAAVSFGTFSGTWTDAEGNSGPFVFGGAATGGKPRPGPAGLGALATIPSGVTVTGEYVMDAHQPSGAFPATDAFTIMLPAVAPLPLTDAAANFAAGSGAYDADSACTGTISAPTAPRGKVCVYVQQAGGLTMSTATAGSCALQEKCFRISFTPLGTGSDLYLYMTWAYTAP